MSQATVCPKCGAILKDDYGMVTCPKCDSILFIDLDGMAHMGVAEDAPRNSAEEPAASHLSEPEPYEPISTDPASEVAVEDYATPFDPPKFDENWSATPDAEPFATDFSASQFASQNETRSEPAAQPDYFQPNEELAQPSFEPQPEAAAPVEEEFSMESFMGGHVEPADDAGGGQGAGGGNQFSNPDDPLDLNDFANSEISQAKDGHLLFRLYIDGIDSKEIRDSLREAITDQRFAWDASRIMANVTKGKLKIDQLPPVKAVILVNRIKRLPIQIRWEQYEITQSDEP